jgi:hypothetical protein
MLRRLLKFAAVMAVIGPLPGHVYLFGRGVVSDPVFTLLFIVAYYPFAVGMMGLYCFAVAFVGGALIRLLLQGGGARARDWGILVLPVLSAVPYESLARDGAGYFAGLFWAAALYHRRNEAFAGWEELAPDRFARAWRWLTTYER